MKYSLNPGTFKSANGTDVPYLQWINLDYLWSEEFQLLPNLIEDEVIYCIHNDVNNKCYIGQTLNFFIRFLYGGISHRHSYENNNYNKNYALYNAINKYSPSKFTVYIIESDLGDLLDEREIHWIDVLESCTLYSKDYGYNMTFGGNFADQLCTDEVKLKAWQSRVERNQRLFGNNANSWSHCSTKDIRNKASHKSLINRIILQVKLLESFDIQLTPINYYRYYPSTHKGHNIIECKLIHLESLCTRLYDDPPITSHPEWNPEWTPIAYWFDNQDNWSSLPNINLIKLNVD